MILNLEAEKAVDSSKRLCIVSAYSQLRTALGILGLIGDLAFQLLHSLYTWRHRGMDKHRNGKIALGKLNRDHRQVVTDRLLAGCVRGLVALNLNGTHRQPEGGNDELFSRDQIPCPDRHERLRQQNRLLDREKIAAQFRLKPGQIQRGLPFPEPFS